MLALLAALALQAPEAARAESLLAAGALPPARALAEALVARYPRDPAAHELLGRVWLRWPVFGRYHALAAFRAAARLAPHDPTPRWGEVLVGFHLGSDEGEVVAREALLAIFALDPAYPDAWERFQQLYRNDAIARRAAAAFARHPHHPVALERRAELALALGDIDTADSLAALVPAPVARYTLRADAAWRGGRDGDGQAWHDSAVARAAEDSGGLLWRRAWIVASPDEAARYAATAPSERRAFFEHFWSRRDPNLFTPANERLGEHARRSADARHRFRLLHPFRMVYRSRTARVLAEYDRRQRLDVLVAAGSAGGAALDSRTLQDSAHAHAYRAGLDARGLVFVRHGAPDARVACTPEPLTGLADPSCTSALDGEGWLYRTPVGPRSVSFFDGEYFAPVSPAQLRWTEQLLASDRSTVPAPLPVVAAVAFFAADAPGATQVYVRGPDQALVLALWDSAGLAGRDTGEGMVAAAVPPGAYQLGLDADSAGVLGRVRTRLAVPAYGPDGLRVSSLVLSADTSAHDRAGTVRGMPPDLRYQAGVPLGAYAEVYGLAPAGGMVRYRARYTFAPARSFLGRLARGRDPVSFAFERRAPAGARVIERLAIEPGRVPPGRYRVTLAVTDLATNVKSETVALDVTLR